jgi:hypothetical protein
MVQILVFLLILLLTPTKIISQSPVQFNNSELESLLQNPFSPTPSNTQFDNFTELQEIFEIKKEPEINSSYLTAEEKVLFKNQGYVVRDFEELSVIRLKISKNTLNFKPLNTEKLQLQSTKIYVETTENSGFQLFVNETSGLISGGSLKIPPTSCDRGSKCHIRRANRWQDHDSGAGWGYNITGDKVYPDFVSEEFYRPFSEMESIMIAESSAKKNVHNLNLTLKIFLPEYVDNIFNGKLSLKTLSY